MFSAISVLLSLSLHISSYLQNKIRRIITIFKDILQTEMGWSWLQAHLLANLWRSWSGSYPIIIELNRSCSLQRVAMKPVSHFPPVMLFTPNLKCGKKRTAVRTHTAEVLLSSQKCISSANNQNLKSHMYNYAKYFFSIWNTKPSPPMYLV